MPRKLRVHVPGGIYHVTLRGNHRQPIFRQHGERKLLNLIVARAIERFEAKVHAYCWMTNHLHLLVRAPKGNLPQSKSQSDPTHHDQFQCSSHAVGDDAT